MKQITTILEYTALLIFSICAILGGTIVACYVVGLFTDKL